FRGTNERGAPNSFAARRSGTALPFGRCMGGRSAVAAACAAWLGLLLGAGHGTATALAALGIALLFAALALRAPDRVGTVAVLLAVLLAGSARGAAHRLLL